MGVRVIDNVTQKEWKNQADQGKECHLRVDGQSKGKKKERLLAGAFRVVELRIVCVCPFSHISVRGTIVPLLFMPPVSVINLLNSVLFFPLSHTLWYLTHHAD